MKTNTARRYALLRRADFTVCSPYMEPMVQWVSYYETGMVRTPNVRCRGFGRWSPLPRRPCVTADVYCGGGQTATSKGSSVPAPDEQIRALVETETAASALICSSAADRKSTRLNSSHRCISYAVCCLKKKKT